VLFTYTNITTYLTAAGPFKILNGSVIIALNKSKTAVTVIPINLNGKSNNQTIGYRIKPIIAMGQQMKSKINHKKKVAIICS